MLALQMEIICGFVREQGCVTDTVDIIAETRTRLPINQKTIRTPLASPRDICALLDNKIVEIGSHSKSASPSAIIDKSPRAFRLQYAVSDCESAPLG